MTDKPKPGSDEAIALGCECARLDNGNGRGIILNGERVWWINEDCPIHGMPALAEPPRHSEDDA